MWGGERGGESLKHSFLHFSPQVSIYMNLYLVNTVVAISLLGGVFADAAPFGAAHHSHWLSRPPVPRLCSVFVIQRRVAV